MTSYCAAPVFRTTTGDSHAATAEKIGEGPKMTDYLQRDYIAKMTDFFQAYKTNRTCFVEAFPVAAVVGSR